MDSNYSQPSTAPERRRDSGAGMVEYVLLVAFIALMLIAAIGFLAGALDDSFRTSGSAFS